MGNRLFRDTMWAVMSSKAHLVALYRFDITLGLYIYWWPWNTLTGPKSATISFFTVTTFPWCCPVNLAETRSTLPPTFPPRAIPSMASLLLLLPRRSRGVCNGNADNDCAVLMSNLHLSYPSVTVLKWVKGLVTRYHTMSFVEHALQTRLHPGRDINISPGLSKST